MYVTDSPLRETGYYQAYYYPPLFGRGGKERRAGYLFSSSYSSSVVVFVGFQVSGPSGCRGQTRATGLLDR